MAGLAAPAAVGASATPSVHTVTGKITDVKSGFPVPKVCVYPFLVPTGPGVVGASNYVPTQLLYNVGQCSTSAGYYTVTMPSDLLENLKVKALVVADKALVSKVIDLPTTSGTQNISLDVSNALVDVVPLREANPWADVVGLVTDHATGQVLGAGAVVKALDPKDKRLHMYAGVGFTSNTNIDVHYLVPGAAVTTDVASNLNVPAVANTNTTLPTFDVGPLVDVVGRVRANSSTAAPSQLVALSCPATECATLGLTKADGSFEFLTTPDKAHDFHIGGQIIRKTFSAGSASIDTVQLVPTGAKAVAYGAAPMAWFTPRSTVNLFGLGTWNWTGGSLESAPFGWLRQVATGSAKSGLGAYSAWTLVTDPSAKLALGRGSAACVRVQTVTFFAAIGSTNVGPTATQCQSAPVDERALTAKGAWSRQSNANAYAGTLSVAHSARVTLTFTGATGHGLGVVWSRQTKGGAFTVSVNGVKVLTVNTKGATAYQKVTSRSLSGFKKAKIVITTTSSAPTAIDGLAIVP